jgi:hypothetical protein
MSSASKTPESKTIRARPPGADLPSEHGITIDGVVSIPLPPNGLYIGASFPRTQAFGTVDPANLEAILSTNF